MENKQKIADQNITKLCKECNIELNFNTTTDMNSKWCDSCYYTD
jgi:hypothetical protein